MGLQIQGAQRSLSPHVSTRETSNVEHVGLSLQRERYISYSSPRGLGMEVVNSLPDFCATGMTKITPDPPLRP